jgi:hypothetical protein
MLDLTTLPSVQAWINGGSADVVNLQSCITAASVNFLSLTGRGLTNGEDTQSPFNQPVAYTEIYDGNGSRRQMTRNAPVQSIQSVMIAGQPVPASTGFGVPGYAIDANAKSIILQGGRWHVQNGFDHQSGFYQGQQTVTLAYTAGYTTKAVTGELQTIPAGLTLSASSLSQGLNWLADGGVKYFSDGTPLTPSLISPTVGQYYIVSPGVYLFNAADAARQVLLSYTAAGTPADIVLAINQMVALNYKRRQWVGIRSLAMKDVGSTSYTMDLDPSITRVIDLYKRTAIL